MANIFTTIPEKEPISFYKGETIVWKRTDIGADYDPSSYSMVWEASLESDGSTRFSATVTESGTEYTFTLDNSSTASYTAGDYVWFLKVLQTSDSETLVIDSGKITVKDNYFATTGDTRSHAKVMVDKLESLLEGKADADVSSYAIAGRSLNKLTVEEMLKWRDYYKAEYQREIQEFRIGNNEGSGSIVKVRFDDAS
jgi:hypothetical protein|tara:strand:+ start:2652 stop:3242 length:591 start_codon:yes stop_codon:yes gene_type:complete